MSIACLSIGVVAVGSLVAGLPAPIPPVHLAASASHLQLEGIDHSEIAKITVPPGWKAVFTFTSEAAFENAILIIDAKAGGKVHVADNFGSLDPFVFVNESGSATQLLLVGVHPEVGFVQSQLEIQQLPGQALAGGFEDADDADFNDITFTVTVEKR